MTYMKIQIQRNKQRPRISLIDGVSNKRCNGVTTKDKSKNLHRGLDVIKLFEASHACVLLGLSVEMVSEVAAK